MACGVGPLSRLTRVLLTLLPSESEVSPAKSNEELLQTVLNEASPERARSALCEAIRESPLLRDPPPRAARSQRGRRGRQCSPLWPLGLVPRGIQVPGEPDARCWSDSWPSILGRRRGASGASPLIGWDFGDPFVSLSPPGGTHAPPLHRFIQAFVQALTGRPSGGTSRAETTAKYVGLAKLTFQILKPSAEWPLSVLEVGGCGARVTGARWHFFVSCHSG